MYALIYKFKVKKNKESEFIKSWKELTELIYKYEGSLGSRLHKQDDETFIAYAQWPNDVVFNNSGKKLPENVKEIREIMRKACSDIERLFELEVIEDVLKNKTYVQQWL